MDTWMVTALDSDLKHTIVGFYPTEELAKQAVELCNQCASMNDWGAWSEAEYSKVRLEHNVRQMELIRDEMYEFRMGLVDGSDVLAEKLN
jgi:hypothetical protein